MRKFGLLFAATVGALSGAVAQPPLAIAQDIALPEAPGKAKLIDACTQCHGAGFIIAERRTAQEWQDIIDRMVGLGATISDDDQVEIFAYLRANFEKS